MAELLNKRDIQDKLPERTALKIFEGRLKELKRGFNFAKTGEFKLAVQHFRNYLKILGVFFDCEESEITPERVKKNLSKNEIFLICQVYWFLARLYDRSPKLYGQFKGFLDKFVLFSEKQKFQYINSELIRKFLNQGRVNNKNDYYLAYRKLGAAGGNCFISSFCFGAEHLVTQDLRCFKKKLQKTLWGMTFINLYYKVSPKIIRFCILRPKWGDLFSGLFLKPLVAIVYYLWDLKIIRLFLKRP